MKPFSKPRVTVLKDPASWKSLKAHSISRGKVVIALFVRKAAGAGPAQNAEKYFMDLSRQRRYVSVVFAKVELENMADVEKEAKVNKTPSFRVYAEGEEVSKIDNFYGQHTAIQLSQVLTRYMKPPSPTERLKEAALDVKDSVLEKAGELARPLGRLATARNLALLVAGGAAAFLGGRQAARAYRKAVEAREGERHRAVIAKNAKGEAERRRQAAELRKRHVVARGAEERRIERLGWLKAKQLKAQEFALRTALQVKALEHGLPLALVRDLEGPALDGRRAVELLEGVPGGVVEGDLGRVRRLAAAEAAAGDRPGASNRELAPHLSALVQDRRRDWAKEVKLKYGVLDREAVREWKREVADRMCVRQDVPHLEVDWDKYGRGQCDLNEMKNQLLLRTGVDPDYLNFNVRTAQKAWEEYSAELDDAFVRHTRPWEAVRDGTALQPGTAEEERALYRKIWKLPSRRRQYYLGKWRPNPLAIADVPRGILEAAQDAWDSKIYFASPRSQFFLLR